MSRTITLAFILLLSTVSVSSAAVWVVADDGSGDYLHIQDAIDVAGYGDTIVVKAGYYPENITLKSNVSIFGDGYEDTWLNGRNLGTVVTAVDVVNAQIDGLAIYASGSPNVHYGLDIRGGSLIVSNCWIIDNKDGIRIWDGSSATIRNNLIEINGDPDNAFTDWGILCLRSTPLITNNLIRDNIETAIYMGWPESAGAKIINNTIVGSGYEAIWCYEQAHVIIKNNILVNNNVGISATWSSVPDISYNCVWNNTWMDYRTWEGGVAAPGPGDISEDPCFIDYDHYYLGEDSPCIDAGDPDPVYYDVDGSRNDMGWTGGPDGSTGPAYGSIMSGFIFTTVGKIPVNEITQSGDSQGLANVTPETSSDLGIYQYRDAPFGGNLWLHGMFGPLDTSVNYYRILVARWTGKMPPSINDAVPLTDTLTKTYYTIQADGTVKAQRWNCGPYTQGSEKGFYLLTEDGYWAHRDLRVIWHTGSWPAGKYTVFYKAYNSGYNPVILPANTQDHFTIMINNTNVQAEIHAVKKHTGEVVQECGMIDVDTDTENVIFEITAWHPDGYLRAYTLHALYGTNKDLGDIARDYYLNGHHLTGPYWQGVQSTPFNSWDAWDSGMLNPWEICAYQFRLNVHARTTNGYNHIYWRQFNDHYYVNVGACAWCGGADVNHDGKVNWADFARTAQHWLDDTCGPTCQ